MHVPLLHQKAALHKKQLNESMAAKQEWMWWFRKWNEPIQLIDVSVSGYIHSDYIKYTSIYGVPIVVKKLCQMLWREMNILGICNQSEMGRRETES